MPKRSKTHKRTTISRTRRKTRSHIRKRAFLARIKKRLPFIKDNLPILMVVVGCIFMVLSGVHNILRLKALSLSEDLIRQQAEHDHAGKPRISRIYIQWFVDTSVEETTIRDGQWSISEHMASHLGESAQPGESGNIIVYGHNTRAILGNIRALKGGEIIHVYTEDGTEHTYEITLLKEIRPSDTQYLLPTENETLTMYTCSGLFDSQRFIVQAKPMN